MGVAAEKTIATHKMVFRSAIEAAKSALMTVEIEEMKRNAHSVPKLDPTFNNCFPRLGDRGVGGGGVTPCFFFLPNMIATSDATRSLIGSMKARHLLDNGRKSFEKKLSPMLRTNFRGTWRI